MKLTTGIVVSFIFVCAPGGNRTPIKRLEVYCRIHWTTRAICVSFIQL